MRRRVGVAVIIISTSSIDIIGGYGGQLVDDYLLLSYLLDANVVVEWVAREVVWECVSILGGNSSKSPRTCADDEPWVGGIFWMSSSKWH